MPYCTSCQHGWVTRPEEEWCHAQCPLCGLPVRRDDVRISEAFKGKYLKAADSELDKPVKVHFTECRYEDMQDGTQKVVCYFSELDSGLVLNKTNAETISSYLGDDTSTWTGKPVVLYRDESVRRPDGTRCGGIRCRQPKDFKEVVAEPEFEDDVPF